MDKQEITKIGRDYFTEVYEDLKNVHGIYVKEMPSDEACYRCGLERIEAVRKAQEEWDKYWEEDRKYLASLPDEERQYVILKRKYEPTQHGDL